MANADGGAWVKISDLARSRGVDKAAVSRRVARFERLGLLSTRTDGRSKLVNVETFDRVVAATRDVVREFNGRRGALKAGAETRDSVLAHEQARRTKIQADLAQIKYDAAVRSLVPVEEVREAMARAAGELVRVLEKLPMHAEDLAAAIVRDGEKGARGYLRQIARETRDRLASAMRLLASEEEEADG